MGRAFEATDGELAEKLFAALQAGDDAGGDSRGKHSASMIVVRKGGGRNFNNDRYLCLNVDDNPAPLAGLRRLLDMNLGYLYQEKAGRLTGAGKTKEACDAAAQTARYLPAAQAYIRLGILDYNLNDKTAAVSTAHSSRPWSCVMQRERSSNLSVPPPILTTINAPRKRYGPVRSVFVKPSTRFPGLCRKQLERDD